MSEIFDEAPFGNKVLTISATEQNYDGKTFVKQEPYVGDEGIMVPVNPYVPKGTASIYRCLIPKELFIEAYNKYIKEEDK